MTWLKGPREWYAPNFLVPEWLYLVAGVCGVILFSQGISFAMPSPHHAIGAAGQNPEQEESVRQPFTTLIVEFEASGTSDSAGTKTLYLDEGNSRWAEYYETPHQSWMRVSDGTWLFEIDLNERTGTKQWLSRFLASVRTPLVNEEMLAEMGAVKSGTEEVAGVTCDRWVAEDGFSMTTTWVWHGVSIGTEWTSGGMKTTERAARLEIDPQISEERFRVPDGISLTEVTFPGLDLLKAMAADPVPGGEETTFDRSSIGLEQGAFTYPSVELFRSSRMWEPLLGGEDTSLDLDRSVTLIGVQLTSIQEANEAVAGLFGVNERTGQSALLNPTVSDEKRVWWMIVPRIVSELSPLFEATEWSEAQLATARTAARFLSLKSYGPHLDFASSSRTKRREELEVLGRWFVAQLQHPERYAAMVCTMDFGPYAGLPHDTDQLLPAHQTVSLDDTRKLRLCKVGGPEPFVLQCVNGEKLLWSRRISDAPNQTVSRVELLDTPPELGPFGWKVHFAVTWENGHELGHLYLDREADFLFYFMSW